MGNNSPANSTNHASKIPAGFHETTSNTVISLYAKKAFVALKKKGTVDGLSQELEYSPNDWYGVPIVKNERDIRRWMQIVGIEPIESSNALGRVLSGSIIYAVDYMSKKGYYIPQRLSLGTNGTVQGLIKFFQSLSSYSQEKDIEAVSVFLKFLRSTYQTFTLRKNDGSHIFDFETGKIRYKDTQFIKEIIHFFNGSNFYYKKGYNVKFSETSNTASGMTDKSSKPIPFIARFRPKTIDSQICKGVSQYSYDSLSALKDRNALRIEVRTLEDIPHIILVLLESGLFSDLSKVSLEQKGQLFPQSSEVWKNFKEFFLSQSPRSIESIFSKVPREKVKANTLPEREEVKIVSSNPSFEVQIMLLGNTNNTGWKADPFYKMKEDIDEEIRVNQGYIHIKRVLEHIERWLPKLSFYGINDITSKMAFDRFMNIDKKLIPIYLNPSFKKEGPSIEGKKITTAQHAEFFTNKDFIGRAIRLRSKGIPWSFWSHDTGNWMSLNVARTQNNSSFPSSHETSSQTLDLDPRGGALGGIPVV